MKFSLAQRLGSVRSFQIYNDGAITLIDQKVFKYSYDLKLISSIDNAETLLSLHDFIFILDDLNMILTIYDFNKNVFIKIPSFLENLRISSVQKGYLFFYKKSEPRKYGYANLTQIVFETAMTSGRLFCNDSIFFDEAINLIRLYKNSNCILWQHNLSHLGKNPLFNDNRDDKFSKFLGAVRERIFILSEANRIVVLNLADGRLVHIFNLSSEELPNMRDAFIHPDDNNIYCLADHFVKLNTETLKIERNIKVVEDNHDPNVNTILYGIKKSSHQGDFISFTSFTRHRVGFAKWIGLFDYKKEEVAWHYELLPAEGQLSIPAFETPQLAGNKLYILDTNSTLHILEREKEW